MTPEPPRRLGRGLDALLARRDSPKDAPKPAAADTGATGARSSAAAVPDVEREESPLRTLKLSQIRANPYQPRQEFRPEELADLEASLRINGLLQPITVRPAPNGAGYELIAGERRFRAASRLGWTEIPALVKTVDDQTLLGLAMICQNRLPRNTDSVGV